MRRLTQAERYLKYGMTENAVRKQLEYVVLFGKAVLLHKKVVERYRAWEREVRLYERRTGRQPWTPKRIDSFNWRMVRGSRRTRSMHSWGLAVDIDPATNAMGQSKTDIPAYVRKIGMQRGLSFGYYYKHRPDPMHVEWLY